MKTLAMLAILALHALGVWPHLSQHARDTLVEAGTSVHAETLTASGTPPATQISGRALPVRAGAEQFQADADSAMAVDAASSTVLYAKNASAKRPIASITKIATAIVILSRHTPSEVMKVPALPDYDPAAERVGLIAGETYRVSDLVQAMLVNSGNDAADALALADAGTIPKFAARMNSKMNEWGVSGVHFSNPSGLQDADNYATAEALSRIAQLALTNPSIRTMVTQTSGTIVSGDGRSVPLTSTNKLLATGQFYGIKTGYTPAAGECFVGLTRIAGHEVITVILDAGDRFNATQDLTNWISRNYQWL